jgi:hypothetical protein
MEGKGSHTLGQPGLHENFLVSKNKKNKTNKKKKTPELPSSTLL